MKRYERTIGILNIGNIIYMLICLLYFLYSRNIEFLKLTFGVFLSLALFYIVIYLGLTLMEDFNLDMLGAKHD